MAAPCATRGTPGESCPDCLGDGPARHRSGIPLPHDTELLELVQAQHPRAACNP
ncbi:hypothetical protein KRR26_30375 [Corallococcus sp. M34]|uniref:hypothetical protein n=1 Tax=Citreicoccus inhibens TaxID=2849499 RepID=UPI001315739C|nr:hypothetical protein [Citreicoccus inhibens]MBU8899922.1 hypothetical protein [Citreicoccus inhibens]